MGQVSQEQGSDMGSDMPNQRLCAHNSKETV
jgi:hypothetical protein